MYQLLEVQATLHHSEKVKLTPDCLYDLVVYVDEKAETKTVSWLANEKVKPLLTSRINISYTEQVNKALCH